MKLLDCVIEHGFIYEFILPHDLFIPCLYFHAHTCSDALIHMCLLLVKSWLWLSLATMSNLLKEKDESYSLHVYRRTGNPNSKYLYCCKILHLEMTLMCFSIHFWRQYVSLFASIAAIVMSARL